MANSITSNDFDFRVSIRGIEKGKKPKQTFCRKPRSSSMNHRKGAQGKTIIVEVEIDDRKMRAYTRKVY